MQRFQCSPKLPNQNFGLPNKIRQLHPLGKTETRCHDFRRKRQAIRYRLVCNAGIQATKLLILRLPRGYLRGLVGVRREMRLDF